MIKKWRFTYLAFFALVLLSGCSEYQKVLKDSDVKKKYDMAEKLYNEGDYKRAIRIYEQIVPQYVGKPQGERLQFFYANSYYQSKDYYLAAYQFERFTKSYPRSDKAEEAAFMGAKSQYLTSPRYSLEQGETQKAIDRLQIFINTYSESAFLDEANKMMEALRGKLEKKSFEIAKQYNRISDYNASIKSFETFFENFPGSLYKEDAMFYDYLARYNLAINSVYNKKKERIENANEAYNAFKSEYPESKYISRSDKMNSDLVEDATELEELLEKYTVNN
ncbi:outer membrane protein assembly factor BamD [Galbibacter sp.]|jgi:outer membrane protein assembly factor BamD|uniref:outer membrane protein assembly factor BamD n=1 Tax=Galbibacter sp. TaxID=2918471 RepID=UPI003A8CE27E